MGLKQFSSKVGSFIFFRGITTLVCASSKTNFFEKRVSDYALANKEKDEDIFDFKSEDNDYFDIIMLNAVEMTNDLPRINYKIILNLEIFHNNEEFNVLTEYKIYNKLLSLSIDLYYLLKLDMSILDYSYKLDI